MSRRLLFRLLAATPATDHVADAELLRRFVAHRDSAALELVARRHAGAVWAACRHLLPREADAEDAFQATFLALARHAGAVRTPCAGGWLHRVAVHAALKLRERSARVSLTEPAHLDAIPTEAHAPADADAAQAVHEELARLPERERLPVVLCDLEGLSHADAAKVLGWPVGTVSGRLSRARAKLRDRLARRGLTPAALSPGLAPPHLIPEALTLVAGAPPPALLSLSEGAVAMLKAKTWAVVAGVVAVGVAVAGIGAAVGLGQPGPVPKKGPTNPGVADKEVRPVEERGVWASTDPKDNAPSAFPKLSPPELKGKNANAYQALVKACPTVLGDLAIPTDEDGDDRYRLLLMTELQQGRFESQALLQKALAAPATGEALNELGRCLADMRPIVFELWANDRRSRGLLRVWLEEFVVLGKTVERLAAERVAAGTEPPQTLFAARRHRLGAEAELWKAKNAK